MECKFVIGQKVTPITDGGLRGWSFEMSSGGFRRSEAQPIMGEIYTVEGFDIRWKELGIYLSEFVPEYQANGERVPGFAAASFRAVDDREVEAANEMLKKITDRVKEPV